PLPDRQAAKGHTPSRALLCFLEESMAGIPTTRWSIVLQTAGADPEVARRAVRWLCETYWYPVYLFYRRSGCLPDEANDLVQGLFTDLIAGNDFARADRTRGRFRNYLLGAARHRLLNARRGDWREVSLELGSRDGEARYRAEPVTRATPEAEFFAAWSREIVRSVLDELEGEYAARGERDLFGRLVGCITGDDEATYAEIAAAHEKPAAAVKLAAPRRRRGLGERRRAGVAVYTADEDVEDELRQLLAALTETA